MEKVIISLMNLFIVVNLFIGCGNSTSTNEKTIQENSTATQEKNDVENVEKIDLKNSKLYDDMKTVMPFEITEMSSASKDGDKSLYIEFDVKTDSKEAEIKEFYTNCTLVSSYISTQAKNEDFKYLIISNKELGAIATYAPDKNLDGFFKLQFASFSDKENQQLFDEISQSK